MVDLAAEPTDDTPRGDALRGALVSTFRRIMRLYFRDIERVGLPPTADVRGRVFVSNHYNALLDPILVLTDAACEISPIAKSTLWDIPGLRWLLDRAGAVPIIRRKDTPDKQAGANDATFTRIAAHLAGGGNILIFPEGTSHSASQLAPLRSGAARMLLAAAHLHGVPPTFQAAALEFDERDTFRSRCLVLWGPVRTFADLPVAADGVADPAVVDEARVGAATALMEADLRELLVEGASHQERLWIARVAELYANESGDDSLSRWNDIGRQVGLASGVLRALDPDVVADVAAHVDAYYAALRRCGVKDAQIAGAPSLPPGVAPTDRGSRLAAIARAPLAAAGFALYALPYFIPRFVARHSDPDAVSTIKLGAALVVYPVWMGGLVAAALTLLPPPLSLAAAAVAIASPFAALRWLDAWYQRAHDVTPDERATLTRLRKAARVAIDRAHAKLPS
ncbi:MAG: 1-acyl-sn-glycerol-3-phosphate acyltransferase [Proteobacteria bacterium]|nr:1-acyl-sn-glycerol-3-phosphate acyltransferase [Pseudomonadota bacterium]